MELHNKTKIYKCIKQVSKKYKMDVMDVLEIITRSYPKLKPISPLLDRSLELKYRFIQPFDPKFTNIKDKEFINFTRSDNMRLVYSQTKHVTTTPDKTMKFIDSISEIDKESLCLSSFYFLSYNESGFKKLTDKYLYLNELLSYIQKSKLFDFAFSIECFDNLHKFNKITMCDSVSRKNKSEINKLKSCMQNKNVKYARLHLAFIVSSDTTDLISFAPEKNSASHSSQLILDIHDNKAYILESSINDDGDIAEASQQLEHIKDISIQTFLKEYINENIIVEELNLTLCPTVDIQGYTDLCGTWSLYLFVLTILNSGIDRYIIYEIFSQYKQHERDVLIMMFMYWIFKHDKYKGIELKNDLIEGELPSL